jgi:hypothetical protein
MAAIFTGDPRAVRWQGRWTFDPATGDTLEHSWSGPKAAIFALYGAFRRSRIAARVEHRGPVYTLQANIGALQNDAETPQDEWEIDHEMVQTSLFNVPEVTQEAQRWVAEVNSSPGPQPAGVVPTVAMYRRLLEDAVRKGEPNPLPSQFWPIASLVYLELSRGNEATELDRIILRRIRHFSPQYPERAKLTRLPNVYSTLALIETFSVPKLIQDQLPATPPPGDTPKNTFWGWKVRRDRSVVIPRMNKIREEKEWVFAAWARLNYQPILKVGEVLPPLDAV